MNFPRLRSAWDRLKNWHPAGLFVLSNTEFAERFSFYGMKALLVYYLTAYFGLPEATALQTLAIYASLVYLTAIPCGWLTDLFLKQRKAVLVGGVLMAIGHLLMTDPALLYFGMGFIIVGSGFFKPNISTQVGQCYKEGDKRIESAYMIFYMFINLGAFLSPIVCAQLAGDVTRADASWHLGFGAATGAMICSLILYVAMGHKISDKQLTLMDWLQVALFIAGSSAFVVGILWFWPAIAACWSAVSAWASGPLAALAPYATMVMAPAMLSGWLLILYQLLLAALIGWLGYKGFCGLLKWQGFSTDEVHQIVLICVLATFGMLFWIIFEQGSGTMSFFAEHKTDLNAWAVSFNVPWFATNPLRFTWAEVELFNNPAFFQAVNPLFILLLAIPFSNFFDKLSKTRFNTSPIAWQGFGLILAGCGALLMAVADYRAITIGPVLPIWLIAVYFIFTIGELLISPVGLALVNRLSPARAASLLMAVWLGSTAIANYLAHTMQERLHESGQFEKILHSAAEYVPFANVREIMLTSDPLWFFLALLGFACGIIVLLFTGRLRKLSCGKC